MTTFGVDAHAQGKADRMCWLTRRKGIKEKEQSRMAPRFLTMPLDEKYQRRRSKWLALGWGSWTEAWGRRRKGSWMISLAFGGQKPFLVVIWFLIFGGGSSVSDSCCNLHWLLPVSVVTATEGCTHPNAFQHPSKQRDDSSPARELQGSTELTLVTFYTTVGCCLETSSTSWGLLKFMQVGLCHRATP